MNRGEAPDYRGFKGEWEDGIADGEYNLFCRKEQRNRMVAGGSHGVKIAFVVLLVLNWNTFQYVYRLVGIIQLEGNVDDMVKRAMSLSPYGPDAMGDLLSVGVGVKWKGSFTVMGERKSMWTQVGR